MKTGMERKERIKVNTEMIMKDNNNTQYFSRNLFIKDNIKDRLKTHKETYLESSLSEKTRKTMIAAATKIAVLTVAELAI